MAEIEVEDTEKDEQEQEPITAVGAGNQLNIVIEEESAEESHTSFMRLDGS